MIDILWPDLSAKVGNWPDLSEKRLIFCNNFVTISCFWPEKVGKWPDFFEKWPRKNPVIPRVCGHFGQMARFFS